MVVLRTIANSAAIAMNSVEVMQAKEQTEIDALYKLICTVEGLGHHSPCHSQRVVHNAVLLAQHMGLSSTEFYLIGCAAALHHLSVLTRGMGNEERIQVRLGSPLSLAMEPQLLNLFEINPVIISMLTLSNTAYAQHKQQFVNHMGSIQKDDSHRLYQRLHSYMGLESLSSPLFQSDASGPQSEAEASFALTHFDISRLGACIIHLIDAIDHVYTDAITQECHASTELLDYLNVNAGNLFEPTMVEVAKHLLERNLFLLPTDASSHKQSPTATMMNELR